MLSDMFADIPRLLVPSTAGFLLRAALMTLWLTALGCTLGLLLGGLLAVLRQTRTPWLLPARLVAILYVETFRRIPFIITLFLVLYISRAFVPLMPLFYVAAISVCIMSAAFLAEIVRAGLESVPRTQIEAAETLNFGFLRIMAVVVIPQAWPVILPPAVAYVVMFVKDTALASQIGTFELMFAGKALINRGVNAFTVYLAITLLYFAISYPLALLGRWLEARLMQRRVHTGAAPIPISAAPPAGL
jgi:polar amino acid transport system permease protein